MLKVEHPKRSAACAGAARAAIWYHFILSYACVLLLKLPYDRRRKAHHLKPNHDQTLCILEVLLPPLLHVVDGLWCRNALSFD
jgi:hypothetical protein